MLILALTAPVHAALVEAWSYDDFSRDEEIAGTDGWEAGYDEDPWVGASGQGRSAWASPMTDHWSEDPFGGGGPIDNWLVNPAEDVRQGEYDVTTYVTDNDAFGVVFGFEDGAYYLLLVCGEEGNDESNQNCPVSGLDLHSTALVRVDGDAVEVLAQEATGGTLWEEVDVVISMDDGSLTASYGRTELTTDVGEGFALSGIGFYAFNEGLVDEDGVEDGNSAYFRDPVLSWQDEDGDTVVDDEDNCEEVLNPNQADADGDGIGTACDEDEETDPGDTDTDPGDTDTDPGDTDTDPGDTNRPGQSDDEGVELHGGCGCDAGGGLAPTLAVAAAMLAVRRRRNG